MAQQEQTGTRRPRKAWCMAWACSLQAILFGSWAMAGPKGEQVVRGAVQFQRAGDVTTIHASNGAIINYSSFNIAQHETVRFVQPTSTSRVLNRIGSSEPTRIDGVLQANGIVYLVNRAGVIFGQDSVVNAAGLYAAAANISNRDFVRGIDRFTNPEGTVVNQGDISARTVAMIGRHVANQGSIVAPDGMVVLAAGNDVLLTDDPLSGHMYVRITGDTGEPKDNSAPGVDNSGSIATPRGQVLLGAGDMFAIAARNSGSIQGQSVAIEAPKGDVVNTGTIDASGPTGGTVTIRAERIGHFGVIRADGTQGDGGRVVIQGSKAACIEGAISARGGPAGGRGGFVETSGGWLHVGEVPDVSAPGGAGGTYLLDPYDIEIVDVLNPAQGQKLGGKVGAESWLEFSSSPAVSQISFNTLLAALNTARTVIVSTSNGGSQQGNITWKAVGQPIDPDFLGIGGDQGGLHTLALIAHNDIRFQAGMDVGGGANGGVLALVLVPDCDHNGRGGVYTEIVLPTPVPVGGVWSPGMALPKDVEAGSALQVVIYLVKHSPDVLAGQTEKPDLARLMDEAEYEAKKAKQAHLAKGGPTTRPAGPGSVALSMSAGDDQAAVALGKAANSSLGQAKPLSVPGVKKE